MVKFHWSQNQSSSQQKKITNNLLDMFHSSRDTTKRKKMLRWIEIFIKRFIVMMLCQALAPLFENNVEHDSVTKWKEKFHSSIRKSKGNHNNNNNKKRVTLKRVNMALTFVCRGSKTETADKWHGINTLNERTYVNTSHVDTLFITLLVSVADILLCYRVVASLFRNFFTRAFAQCISVCSVCISPSQSRAQWTLPQHFHYSKRYNDTLLLWVWTL